MTTTLEGRDLLTLGELTPDELRLILDPARTQKNAWLAGERSRSAEGTAVAIVLHKPSLRTRMSFEVGCARLGAHPVVMSGPDGAFSRNETVYDTAKVMERYVDAVVIRTFAQSLIEEFAEACSVPVVNALTDDFHPCQVLADLLTVEEHLGQLKDVTFAYVGDGNNMAHSYLLGGALAGMNVRLGCPVGFEPKEEVLEHARGIAAATGATIHVSNDPREAVEGAHVVATDTWASMGQEEEHGARLSAFEGFTVDSALMGLAEPGARFMHCLPAHRGEEVTDEVIDAAYSIVFDEAENRLHAQKALLSLVLGCTG